MEANELSPALQAMLNNPPGLTVATLNKDGSTTVETTPWPPPPQTFENIAIYRSTEMMGTIVRADCNTVKLEFGQKYAQYNNAIKVTYRAKRKRSDSYFYLTSYPFLVIMPIAEAIEPDGMFDPAAAQTTEYDGLGSVTTQESRYSSFDPRWKSDFIAKAAGRKILFQINE